MKFETLSQHLEALEQTSSRLEITRLLAEILQKADTQEIDAIVYLSLGQLAPSFKGVVFNLSDKLVIQAIARAYEKSTQEVALLYKKFGDLGTVVEKLASGNKGKGLSVVEVYQKLLAIADYEGEGSVNKKVNGLAELFQVVDALSSRYIARVPLGKLRLGFSELTVLDALSWAQSGDKTHKKPLQKAYEVLPDIGLLARQVKQQGIKKATASISPVIGVPVMPMLCQRVKSPQEMIEKMGEVGVEPKYDGVRVCIHFKRGKYIKAFTRNMNDVSDMFPELMRLEKYTKASELILDAEGVGIDPTRKSLLDFQTTMQRRRKHDIGATATKIPLNFFIFDILYKDGKNLMDESYVSRKNIISKTINDSGPFKITPHNLTTDPKQINQLYKDYIKQGLEGIIVKKTDSGYSPGRTGYRWVKMKEAENVTGKLSDTLDCVIMGFTAGQGKRVSFGVGQFLAGVLGGGLIKTVTKVGTGLSDEQFKELKKRLEPLIVKKQPSEYEVHKDLVPDFWVKPEVVVELAADDLTVSPKHTAGFALRFPRLVNFRDDKSAHQATTIKEVKKLYELQKK